jgi:lysophospholipase L1-like esterase
MGSAYGFTNCVGWYRAAAGVFVDAGTTPAAAGDAVMQWNDLSGAGNHLTQTAAAARPVFNSYRSLGAGSAAFAPFGQAMNTYAVDEPAAVLFDGNSTFLNVPASLSVGGGGASVILCSRGFGWMPIGFGVGSGDFLGYGFVGGPAQMGIVSGGGLTAFASGATLPVHVPMVHGFVADGGANTTRLIMGTRQGQSIAGNLLNFTAAGGTVGRMPGSYGDLGGGFFNGEILELAVFDTALSTVDALLVANRMQDANGIRADANTTLLAFVGDSQTCGGPGTVPLCQSYPYWLSRAYGGVCKPLQLAYPAATCGDQLAAVQNQLAGQDRTGFANAVAIVCCGIEDIATAGLTDVQTQQNWVTLVQAIKAIAGTKVLAVVPIHQDGASTLSPAALGYLHNFQNWLRGNATDYADALVDWPADARLSSSSTDSTYWIDEFHTTETGDRVKAALLKPALDTLLGNGAVSSGLRFGAFYSGGESYAGAFGNFVKV